MSSTLLEFRRWRRSPMTAVALLAVVVAAIISTAVADPQTNLLNQGCSQYNVTNLSDFYTNLNDTLSDLQTQLSGVNTKFAQRNQAKGSDPSTPWRSAGTISPRRTAWLALLQRWSDTKLRPGPNGARVIYDGCFLR